MICVSQTVCAFFLNMAVKHVKEYCIILVQKFGCMTSPHIARNRINPGFVCECSHMLFLRRSNQMLKGPDVTCLKVWRHRGIYIIILCSYVCPCKMLTLHIDELYIVLSPNKTYHGVYVKVELCAEMFLKRVRKEKHTKENVEFLPVGLCRYGYAVRHYILFGAYNPAYLLTMSM